MVKCSDVSEKRTASIFNVSGLGLVGCDEISLTNDIVVAQD
jgi:hypothetical protein